MTVTHHTVHHDDVTLAVTRGGRGRPLVLCPGLTTTQAGLHELTTLLRRDHHVVTFDLRGHGLSSPSDRYTVPAFQSDLAAVVDHIALPEPPVLAGYSLGADLALHHAAAHPDHVSGLVLVDGANPIPGPFIPESEIPLFRAVWNDPDIRAADHDHPDPARRNRLTGEDILAVNLALDTLRTTTTLDAYRAVSHPIHVIHSTHMAGRGSDDDTRRRNRNWHDGIRRLTHELPHIRTSRLDADHALAITHAPDVARLIADDRPRPVAPGH